VCSESAKATRVRVRHKALETERAYVGWVERFIQHCRSPDLASFGEREIKAFLNDLAVERDVTAGTQNPSQVRAAVPVSDRARPRIGIFGRGSSDQAESAARGLEPAGNRAAVAGIPGIAAADVRNSSCTKHKLAGTGYLQRFCCCSCG